MSKIAELKDFFFHFAKNSAKMFFLRLPYIGLVECITRQNETETTKTKAKNTVKNETRLHKYIYKKLCEA